VLDVDSPRIGTRKITDKLFEPRGPLPWVLPKDFQKLFSFLAQSAGSEFPGAFLRLPGEGHPPGRRFFYQPGRFDVFESGVRIPFRIDSRIPGIERR